MIVGAGHNGLTCAAYLARTGKRVLVLESRERIGGACTIEEPWPGVRMSPCAYLAGLLHPLVIEELRLPELGYSWTPASNGLFVPFEDGSSVQLYDDDEQCEAEIARFSPRDVSGWRAMSDVIRRTRDAIRPPNEHDLWIGEPPTREQLEQRLGNDPEARALLFDWSMAEFVERYLSDERLQIGYLGQGVIGTNASPFDAGTASIHFHHSSGRLGGLPGSWGYVKGGMGMVSFLLADAAQHAGAVIAAGVPVSQILPGKGVLLEGGERIHAPVVVSNADPQTTLRLVGDAADPGWRAQVASVPIEGCTLKLNVWLQSCQIFARGLAPAKLTTSRRSTRRSRNRNGRPAMQPHARGGFPITFGPSSTSRAFMIALPLRTGTHTMSVFSQYVPYKFSECTWDQRREQAKQLAFRALHRFCSNIPDAVIEAEVLGPPDIEKKVGLTGGHIFQGECLPPYMWSNRLRARTPMPGVYLCGACTHPGGSVIAINGRNAAMAVLANA